MSDFNNSVSMAGVGQGLDKALDAAFEKLDIKDKDFEPTPLPPAETEEPPTAEALPPEEDDELPADRTKQKDRQRDPKGKFAGEKVQGKTEPPPSAKPLDAQPAPGHWNAQQKEAYGKLPPETQRVVLDIAKTQDAALTRLANENARHKPIAEGIRSALTEKHREQLRQAGVDEVGGFKQLLKYHDMATDNPAGYVRMVMQNARLDPRQVFREYFTGEQPAVQPAQPGQAQPPALHPQIVQALQTIAGRVQNIEKTQTDGQRLQEEAETNRLMRLVTDFETEAGQDGNPLRPHFDAVRSQVFEQLHAPSVRDIADPRERLQRAYEIAVYGDPTLRGGLVASEAQRLAKEQQTRDDVAKARRARPLPLNGTQAPIQGARVRTLDDALDATRRKLGV